MPKTPRCCAGHYGAHAFLLRLLSFVPAMASINSSPDFTGLPLIATITSPDRRPALSAGEPGRTLLMTTPSFAPKLRRLEQFVEMPKRTSRAKLFALVVRFFDHAIESRNRVLDDWREVLREYAVRTWLQPEIAFVHQQNAGATVRGFGKIIGPASRIAEYKQIETTSLHHEDFPNLQQFRWGPERIADTPQEARSRLFVLPGSHFSDPEFSWKHVVPPAAIGFVASRALGPSFVGDMFVGAADLSPNNGVLFRFNLTGNRRKIAVDDPRLEDRVADNVDFHDLTESESLLIGTDFGVVTDIRTGPNGNLFLVSLTNGAIYEIFRRR